MKTFTTLIGVTAFASTVRSHATWQQLWINGKDQGGVCVRAPPSNNPIENVSSNNIRCNANPAAAQGKCTVAAGDTVTIEMHQHASRACSEEAIGGDHNGPVLAYLSKVSDSATADASTPFFKIFQDTWAKKSGGGDGKADYWGTKDLNANCGKMDFKIPSNIAAGDYLLRTEAIALHTANSVGGAQFYMSCYQLTITGGGSSNPSGVTFPGAYKATDPGIQINIYQNMNNYIAPGPAVIPGGTEAVAGKPGAVAPTNGNPTAAPTTTFQTSTTAPAPTTTSGGGGGGCTTAKYGQCGGSGYTGCLACASGSSCQKISDWYSQCL